MSQPTLADIARAAGVSKMTVSRALRGEGHVRPELAQAIRQAAQQLGYTPDPELGRLMTHLRHSRGAKEGHVIALVWSEPAAARSRSFWPRMVESGAAERAAELGYRLEVFDLGAPGITAGKLGRILQHRGVRGLVIAPLLSRSRGHLRLPWQEFSTVVIGLGHAQPAHHRVHHHHFQGMHTALRQLRREGFRRVGFCAPATVDQRMYGAWSASFLTHHPLGHRAAAGLLHLPREPQKDAFIEWLERACPEVLLDSARQFIPWLLHLPEDRRPPAATLSWSPEQAGVPGLDQRPAELGRAALDLLVAQLNRNERGIPACAKTVMIEGVWLPSPAPGIPPPPGHAAAGPPDQEMVDKTPV